MNPNPPVRMCIFGATPAPDWLSAIGLPLDADIRTVAAADAAAALRTALQACPGENLILLRADTALPPFWFERLARALELPGVLVVSPLDNADPERAPLPPGQSSDVDARCIDALCFAHGRRQAIDWPTWSPLLSAWNGTALRGINPEKIRLGRLPPSIVPWRSVLLDHLYVADPLRELHGPPLPVPGTDAPPASALGELRECVAAALPQATGKLDFYPGLDAKPVVLHILHGWGGGAERFVRDLAAVDDTRHHLVFTACGNFDRRRYGETLQLLDAALTQPPLRATTLSAPIASTALAHQGYREFLDAIVRDYGVDAIVVSSLIGHSLDALRTGLPTVYFIHDFYPLWPLLHRNLDDAGVNFNATQLRADLAGADAGFEFAERDPDWWLVLREALADAALQAHAQLIAPSHAAMRLCLRLQPRLSTLPQSVIPHGIAPWPDTRALPAPPHRERLRLLVLGRVRRGKAAHLLRQVLPRLHADVELFLIGGGPEAREFFGRRGVHILINYRPAELPALLARVAPDAALILPDFAETFSYTLSELCSLGIPVLASRLGALAERIDDGVNGFLVAPDADAILTAIARLREQPRALERVRAALVRPRVRTLHDMATGYRDLLPAVHRAVRYPLIEAVPAQIAAQMRAAEIGMAQRDIATRKQQIADQQHELERRAEWAFGLDTQIQRVGASLRKLQDEFAERSAWALRLNAQLQTTSEERDRLSEERDRIIASLSWRITKPLRYCKRQLRTARMRLRFLCGRLRAIMHRTRGSLASRGLGGTIRRAADEFRRPSSLHALVAVAAPSEEFAPFTVPTNATPNVSIVIPAFNKIAYTVACLHSLAEHAGDIAFEVIVVDDASSDATAQRLAQIGGIRSVRNAQNLGFVGSCNAGAQVAQGEFIAFLNNDTVVTAGWLGALLRCFDEQPECGLAGAKLVYPDGRLQEAGGIVFRDGSAWNYGRFDDPADPRFEFRREVDYCSGAAIVLRRDFFHALGGFDTRYAPAYYEDTDLAFAVRAAGKKVSYEPRAVVFHFEGVTAGTNTASGMKRFQSINRAKFQEKWKSELILQPAPILSPKHAQRAANWRARGRILIIDACTPMPDHDSGSLRMFNLMRLLREMDFAVSFLPDNRRHEGTYTQALQALGVEALYHPFAADPIAWLRERGHELDAIVLSRHYVAANYVGLARLYAPQARLIFDTVDLHYLREQRAAELADSAELAQQAARTRTQELKLMRECDVTLVVSAAEKSLLAREVPDARVEILSNVHEIHGRRREFDARRDLVFVGGFQHPPNVDAVLWFVHEVWPHVRAALADAVFHIIGSRAPKAIADLAHGGVIVHGFVADIAPFMDGCRVSVAPLRYGAGIKGKINMAMSYGLPVVATTPAVEGMHVRAGADVMVADTAADVAAAIVRVYTDAALWKTLSDNGVANVREHFSFAAARAALARILTAS